MKKIAISGGYGMGNAGDEAILASMLSELSNQCDVEFTVFSWDPEKTTKLHKVKAVNAITDIFNIIKTIYQSDLLILGGGGLLHDRTSIFHIPFWLSKVVLAKILGKPVMLYAIGVGPLDTKLGKLLTRLVLNHVDLIVVREEKSKEVLKGIGVFKRPIHVTADPALNLTPVEPKKAEMILAEEGIKVGTQPLVGITACRFFSMGRIYLKMEKILPRVKDPRFEKFKKAMAQVADDIAENFNARIVFFPEIHEIDTKVALEIRQLMQNKDSANVISGDYDPRELRGIIGLMDMVISMRLHFIIFAAGMNVPIVGLIYAPKVESFLEKIDQLERAVNVKDISKEELLEKINDTWNLRDQIKRELNPKVEALKKNALLNAELTKEILKC